MLGNGRIEAYCYDGKTRLCNIRGKMRKKVLCNIEVIIIRNGSLLVILSLLDFETSRMIRLMLL